jgi:leader peptidase (prepilin peptidase)/N-methyltransferase
VNLAAMTITACIGALAGASIPDVVVRFSPNVIDDDEAGTSQLGRGYASADTGGRALRAPTRATTALIAAAVCSALGGRIYPDPQFAVAMVTALLGIAAAFIDIRCLRLPNVIVLSGTAICLISVTAEAIAHDQPGRLIHTLAGTLAVTALWLLLSLVAGIGLGDVKTVMWMSVLAGWTSTQALVVVAAGPALIHAVCALVRLALRRARLRTALPMGPAIIAAGMGALLLATVGSHS